MFKQFLQLNLQTPHNKQLYYLKRNELVLKQSSQSIKFDSICYSADDIMSKLIFEIISKISKDKEKQSMAITFNYNLDAKDLILFMSKLIEIKIFEDVQLGHFEIKNGHISDYHSNTSGINLIDDLDQFEKDINNSVKLDRLWKINQILEYKQVTPVTVNEEMSRTNKKFGKRTNEFFVIEINNRITIVLIVLPRNRDIVFSKEQEKQIEELYIITKHAQNIKERNICFNTPIAQILKNYLQKASMNFFVSSYPQNDKPLSESLKLPLRMSHPHQEEIMKILQAYNKDKLAQLQLELEKSKKKLKDTQAYVKAEGEVINKLIKIYTKTFNSVFPSIDYLKERGITNVKEHIEWQKKQIKDKEEEVAAEEAELKNIHKEIIMQEKRHLFYLNKIKGYKQQVLSRKVTPASTPKTSFYHSIHEKQNAQEKEELLLYYYNPQKQIEKYRQLKEEEIKNRINGSKQKQQFMRLLADAKKKLNKEDYNAFQQQYYHLINE